MARVHHYRRRQREDSELQVTTFMNLMVVLVPFLLITAVFSRLAIAELDLPSAMSKALDLSPIFRIEIVVRKGGIEVMDGAKVVAAFPKTGDAYDLSKLSEYLAGVKSQFPEKEDASVLLEPDVPYDNLIQVMDAVRSVEKHDGGQKTRTDLFTSISIGDAP